MLGELLWREGRFPAALPKGSLRVQAWDSAAPDCRRNPRDHRKCAAADVLVRPSGGLEAVVSVACSARKRGRVWAQSAGPGERKQPNIDEENSVFWNTLCETNCAKSCGRLTGLLAG
jgi:hypothetical protein